MEAIDEDGYIFMSGRADDVINGRTCLSTAEMEEFPPLYC
jgi:acyl-coenzyme A synthetase/AMP-(fatty) acid ligase